MRLTELAIKRPAFITMVFVALAVLGLYSYNQMGVDLLPRMDWPIVSVVTVYQGAGPREVENDVTKPMENALSTLNNVDNIRSYSLENVSIVVVQFSFSADIDAATNDVQRNVDMVRSTLPREVKAPQVEKVNLNAVPILRISVFGNMSQKDLYHFVKDHVQNRLEQVAGVATVDLVGGQQREIKVLVDNSKLRAYHLSLLQVDQVLRSNNLDFPAGRVIGKEKEYTVRLAGKFKSLDELKNVVVNSTPEGVVHLSDIAKVEDSYKTDDQTFSRIDGKPAIGIILQKTSDANSVEVSSAVRETLTELENEYSPRGLKFVVAQDITRFTKNSINEVKRDLGLAILMVAITLFLFLHSFRNSIIVLLSIPTSLITTFIFMHAMGFTVNLVSTMGLALVIGILVDDSIVVLENIHRHLELGEEKKRAALNGRSEIGFAAIAITLVDVVVFLPIALVGGIVGKIFREFGLTVVVSTLLSLFVSFTLTPMLASKWSKITHFEKGSLLGKIVDALEGFQKRLDSGYRGLISWALSNRRTIITISAAALLLSVALVPLHLIGSEFMTKADRGEFALNVEMPAGTSLEKTNETLLGIESVLKNDPNIKRYFTTVGKSERAFSNRTEPNLGQVQIEMVDPDKRTVSTEKEMEIVKDVAYKFPVASATTNEIGMFGTADQAPIDIEVQGEDLQQVVAASNNIAEIMKRTPGITDVKTSWQTANPELKVIVDPEKAASFGLTMGEVALGLQTAIQGDVVTKYNDNGTDYDVRLQLARRDRATASNLENMTFMSGSGKQVYLSQIADVVRGSGPTEFDRKDRERLVTVLANLTGSRSLGDVTRDINKGIAAIGLPSSVRVFFGGDNKNMSDMFHDMMIAIAMAVLFVYMIMVALFESYAHPFTIMFSLPMALVGGLFALFLTNQTLNMFSMIGILMSMGLVTKNAILLVDYTNTLRSRGLSVIDALIKAGETRLRPIIMTTATMVFGMMPLALGLGAGSEMRQSMAIVVIGALISSTLLTLVLVPVMYTYVEGFKVRFPALFRRLAWLTALKGKPRPAYAESLTDPEK